MYILIVWYMGYGMELERYPFYFANSEQCEIVQHSFRYVDDKPAKWHQMKARYRNGGGINRFIEDCKEHGWDYLPITT